jgi:hypothetical protein
MFLLELYGSGIEVERTADAESEVEIDPDVD